MMGKCCCGEPEGTPCEIVIIPEMTITIPTGASYAWLVLENNLFVEIGNLGALQYQGSGVFETTDGAISSGDFSGRLECTIVSQTSSQIVLQPTYFVYSNEAGASYEYRRVDGTWYSIAGPGCFTQSYSYAFIRRGWWYYRDSHPKPSVSASGTGCDSTSCTPAGCLETITAYTASTPATPTYTPPTANLFGGIGNVSNSSSYSATVSYLYTGGGSCFPPTPNPITRSASFTLGTIRGTSFCGAGGSWEVIDLTTTGDALSPITFSGSDSSTFSCYSQNVSATMTW